MPQYIPFKTNAVKFLFKGIPGISSLYHRPKASANLSKEAKKRLQWFDYYHKHQNVAQTCRYFGIPRKTFYYWKKRYDPRNLLTLETQNMAPKRKRQREISFGQEQRIIALRKQYLRYGKEKSARTYETTYGEKISSWKIQKVIEKKKLYYNPIKAAEIARKRKNSIKKKKITELKKRERTGFLICLDLIVIYWNGLKRYYIFTAIDYYSKIAFARAYSTKSSRNAGDFLLRLNLLLDGKIENIQRDNGSEFQDEFEKELNRLKIGSCFNRIKTPDDNPCNERFNRTLKEEFIQLGNFTPNLIEFNKRLTEWLIECNFRRPHQALGYLPPINFHFRYHKVLPRHPSDTPSGHLPNIVLI